MKEILEILEKILVAIVWNSDNMTANDKRYLLGKKLCEKYCKKGE